MRRVKSEMRLEEFVLKNTGGILRPSFNQDNLMKSLK